LGTGGQRCRRRHHRNRVGGVLGEGIADALPWLVPGRAAAPSPHHDPGRQHPVLRGITGGLALYPLGGFASNDHRPAFLGFGLASLLPLLALIVIPFLTGRNIREAFVAFAVGQGAPVWATCLPLAGGLVCLDVALVGFLPSGS
jgi:hypothetical protein